MNGNADQQGVLLKKVFHHGSWRIGLYFKYNPELIAAIKDIPERKYSKTLNCWYLPYTKEAFHNLKKSNISYSIDVSIETRRAAQESDNIDIDTNVSLLSEGEKDSGNPPTDINTSSLSEVLQSIMYNSGYLIIEMTYSKKEVDYLKTLKRSYWNKKEKKWICQANMVNLKSLQNRYQYWTEERYHQIANLIQESRRRPRAILQMDKTDNSLMVLKFKSVSPLPTWIKTAGNRSYDKASQSWTLPNKKTTKERLMQKLSESSIDIYDYTLQEYADVEYVSNWSKRKKFLLDKTAAAYHDKLTDYIDSLIRERYSWNTVKQYTAAFTRYLYYAEQTKMDRDQEETVIAYMNTIADKNVSYQEINRHLSAIRLYFNKVYDGSPIDFKRVNRPRRFIHFQKS